MDGWMDGLIGRGREGEGKGKGRGPRVCRVCRVLDRKGGRGRGVEGLRRGRDGQMDESVHM